MQMKQHLLIKIRCINDSNSYCRADERQAAGLFVTSEIIYAQNTLLTLWYLIVEKAVSVRRDSVIG